MEQKSLFDSFMKGLKFIGKIVMTPVIIVASAVVLPIARLVLGKEGFQKFMDEQGNKNVEKGVVQLDQSTKEAAKTVEKTQEKTPEKVVVKQQEQMPSEKVPPEKTPEKTPEQVQVQSIPIEQKEAEEPHYGERTEPNINDIYYELVNELSPAEKIDLIMNGGDPRLPFEELLDLYAYDFNPDVRMAVADCGMDSHLTILLEDENEKVRNYAMDVCQRYDKQHLIPVVDAKFISEEDFKKQVNEQMKEDESIDLEKDLNDETPTPDFPTEEPHEQDVIPFDDASAASMWNAFEDLEMRKEARTVDVPVEEEPTPPIELPFPECEIQPDTCDFEPDFVMHGECCDFPDHDCVMDMDEEER